MASFDRIDRISPEVQRAIDSIIRDELNDPRIGGTWSIVRCEVTRDLRYCKVRVSILEENRRKDMMAALTKAAGFIRRELGRRVDLRYVPEILFELDTNIEYAARINQLMRNRATIDALAEWLRAHDDFVLIGHVNADGDATGSCMAVMLALRSMGKRAFVCLPGGIPKMFARYPSAGEVVSPEDALPFAPKAAFALDVSEKPRMAGAEAVFDGCADSAVLDHHATNPGFGDVCVVDGDRIATGELALELIDSLGVKLNREIATWLYIAISTDSGHFSFEGTRSTTMAAAGRLIDAGVDVPRLTRELYHTRSKGRTQLLGVVLAGLEVSGDGKMAWARLTEDMLVQTGALGEDQLPAGDRRRGVCRAGGAAGNSGQVFAAIQGMAGRGAAGCEALRGWRSQPRGGLHVESSDGGSAFAGAGLREEGARAKLIRNGMKR